MHVERSCLDRKSRGRAIGQNFFVPPTISSKGYFATIYVTHTISNCRWSSFAVAGSSQAVSKSARGLADTKYGLLNVNEDGY
jgi:hypothetical protein